MAMKIVNNVLFRYFEENDITDVIVPDGTVSVRRNAFYKGNDELIIYGEANSFAEQYARTCGIKFQYKFSDPQRK